MKTNKAIEDFLKGKGIELQSNPEHQPTIDKLTKWGAKVVAIIEGDYVLGGCDEVKMISYLVYTKEDTARDFIDSFNSGLCYAYVVNPTWGIQEFGSIGVGFRQGRLVRTY